MASGDTPDSIDQTAIGWVMALHDAPGDAHLREALVVWLAADPAHRAAYAQVRRVWLLTGLLPPAKDETQATPAGSCEPRSS